MPRGGTAAQTALERLISGYRPTPGVPDELVDASGAVRPVWQRFMQHLAAQNTETVSRMFARGDAYLRSSGVFLRQYTNEKATERPWPLSHVPVLIHESEWETISKGLVERADLLERVVADIYGDNSLVRDGILPGDLIAQSPEWVRGLVGVAPVSRRFLHFVAFEISRGPDGTWWVLNDRTQAPSGAGYALENRVATSRVYSDFYADAQVRRVAGFFSDFRTALLDMRRSQDSHAAILTPGPFSETYFEQSYIARYLGLLLVEGEDLVVNKGRVCVRTVSGLQPVDVLWRRLDTLFCDPLELEESSQLGTPGLVNAVRERNVSVVNALGAGILESRALLAFLPRIARHLLGKPLSIPNIATWWCGQEAEKAEVLSRLDELVVAPALSTRQMFDPEEASMTGPALRAHGLVRARDLIEREGRTLVGQEAISFSTSPAWSNGTLVPRPMSLRVFMVRTETGWSVMPGGFARIGAEAGTNMLSMQTGSAVADVWIVSDSPVVKVTNIGEGRARQPRARQGALPSKAAENLYWLARYVERAEGHARLVRAQHVRLSEAERAGSPLLTHLSSYLTLLGLGPSNGVPPALAEAIGAASRAAGSVRDRLSQDGWAAIMQLETTLKTAAARDVRAGDDAAGVMGTLLRQSSAFTGLLQDNMYRFTEWRFLSLGRSIERLMALSSALSNFLQIGAPQGSLDLALEFADSTISHRRRYGFQASRESVLELLALDALNPRSLVFHLTELETHTAPLAELVDTPLVRDLRREVCRFAAAFPETTPDEMGPESFLQFRKEIGDLSDMLTAAFLN